MDRSGAIDDWRGEKQQWVPKEREDRGGGGGFGSRNDRNDRDGELMNIVYIFNLFPSIVDYSTFVKSRAPNTKIYNFIFSIHRSSLPQSNFPS